MAAKRRGGPRRAKGRAGGARKGGGRAAAAAAAAVAAAGAEQNVCLRSIPVKHFNERERLRAELEEGEVPKIVRHLKAGFSAMCYGFGSKKVLLEDIAQSRLLDDGAVVVADGFNPALTVRAVLAAAVQALRPGAGASAGSPAEALVRLLGEGAGDGLLDRLYLLVHNIDGPSLRTAEAQGLLARAAALPHVHLIASADHIHTPLMWDKETGHAYNWIWHDLTTFTPYALETAHIPQAISGKVAKDVGKRAALVLASLTPNARSVFRVIAELQTDPDTGQPANGQEQGPTFHALYTACRERFLVSSEFTLQSHLSEFRDHELVQTAAADDGVERLRIPFPAETISWVAGEMD